MTHLKRPILFAGVLLLCACGFWLARDRSIDAASQDAGEFAAETFSPVADSIPQARSIPDATAKTAVQPIQDPVSAPVAEVRPVVAAAPRPQKPSRAWAGSEHFTPRMKRIVDAVEAGRPLQLTLGQESRTAMLTTAHTLTDDFQVTRGKEYENRIPTSVRVFKGLSTTTRTQVQELRKAIHLHEEGHEGHEHGPKQAGSGLSDALVTMSVVNGEYGLSLVEPDGAYTTVRRDPVSGEYRALTIEAHEAALSCGDGGLVDGERVMHIQAAWAPDEETWAQRGVPVDIDVADEPEILAVNATGITDPSTGVNDRSLEITPFGQMYEGQLKIAPEIWGVDRKYTGTNTTENLEYQAAYHLAMQAMVAGNYEYQLGMRRQLMELMLFPDDPASNEDWGTVGSSGNKLVAWRLLANNWRPRGTYNWSFAEGFTSIGGGLGYVGTYHGYSSAGISGNWHWVIVAHEAGHNAGSGHTDGGVMNPYVGDSHDWFTFRQGSTTTTAAKNVYDRVNGRGYNTGILRHPNEMPFARHDNISTAIDTPIAFDPRSNDLLVTPGGSENNEIRIVELSAISPFDAGTASFTESGVTFSPASGYEGLAWFSYTIRGTVGNNGDGWLHRATVAVTVGSDTRSLTAITIPAGKAVELRAPSNSGAVLSQPSQAIVAYHKQYYTSAHKKYVIYADPTASGVDSFDYTAGSGSTTVNITYTAPETVVAVEDVVMYEQDSGAIRFNPLGNDRGQGSRFFVQDPDVTLILTNTVVVTTDEDYVDNSFSLVSATLIDTGKGTLTTEQSVWPRDSVAANDNSGYVNFTPNGGATGVAQIEYVVRDNLGNTDTGDAYVVLPLATINRPDELGATVNGFHETTGILLEGQNHTSTDYPLSGTVTDTWSLYKGDAVVTYDDANAAVTPAFFDRPGSYTMQLQASDNGFTTARRVLVQVVADSGLPITPNLGGYATFSTSVNVAPASPYDLDNLSLTIVDDAKSGSGMSYLWSQLAGPATAVFTTPTDLGTDVTLPSEGVYSLRLTMDDGKIKTVQNFDVWRTPDTDADGLPDPWETAVFGDLTHGPNENTDGDVHTVLQEFIAGSNPVTGQHLKFTSIDVDASNNMLLTWDTQQFGPGSTRKFTVYESTDSFTGAATWSKRREHLDAAGATTSYLAPYDSGAPELCFFRVTAEGTPTTATSDIIGARRFTLKEGVNYIGTPFTPDATTVGSILDDQGLPAGASESASTVVDFWDEDTQAMTLRVWNSNASGFEGWRESGSFNDASAQAVDLARGMVVTIRAGFGGSLFHLTGRVPTGATQTTNVKDAGYTLTNVNYPTRVTLSSLNLTGAGFVGGVNILFSDVVQTYNSSVGAFNKKYWYDSVNATWRSAAQNSPVADPVLVPGEPLLILRRNRGSDINWSVTRPYATPLAGP